MHLDEMTVLITGVTGSIGEATAKLLCQQGVRVIGQFYEDTKTAHLLQTTVKEYDGELHLERCDLSDISAVKQFYANTHDRLGHIHGFVHTATPPLDLKAVYETRYEDIQPYMAIYMGALLALNDKILPEMIDQRFGRIIMLSSITAHQAVHGFAAYASAKSASESYIRNLALETGRFGITANTIVASLIDTKLTKIIDEKSKRKAAKENNTGLLVTPQEIATSVQFLLGDVARSITGTLFRVTG